MTSADVLALNPQYAALLAPDIAFKSATEANFAAWLTTHGRTWLYEPVTLHLAKRLDYTPDFIYPDVDGVLCVVEVKGSKAMRGARASRIAWKAAAEKFYYWRFVWVEPERGAGWKWETYSAS